MSEEPSTATLAPYKPEKRVPHSEEVEKAIIDHLIKDVVTLQPVKLKFPEDEK